MAAGAGARGGGGGWGGGVGGSVQRGGAVDHARSASPVLAARGSTGGVASGAPSSLAGLNGRSETTAAAVEDSRARASGVTAAARGSLTPREGDVVDERVSEGGVSYVQGFAARMRHLRQQQAGDREQQQGGRRSLSDFLREIEEIVRIQRTEVGAAYVGLELGRAMLLCGSWCFFIIGVRDSLQYTRAGFCHHANTRSSLLRCFCSCGMREGFDSNSTRVFDL